MSYINLFKYFSQVIVITRPLIELYDGRKQILTYITVLKNLFKGTTCDMKVKL